MTQSNTDPSSSGDSKDIQRRTARSTDKDYSRWLRVCPSCGANNPKYMESCTECDVVFEPGKDTDVMGQCPTCDGKGTMKNNDLTCCSVSAPIGSLAVTTKPFSLLQHILLRISLADRGGNSGGK
jgi:hypothetical protein